MCLYLKIKHWNIKYSLISIISYAYICLVWLVYIYNILVQYCTGWWLGMLYSIIYIHIYIIQMYSIVLVGGWVWSTVWMELYISLQQRVIHFFIFYMIHFLRKDELFKFKYVMAVNQITYIRDPFVDLHQ